VGSVAYNLPEGKDHYKWYISGIYCQLGDKTATYHPPFTGRLKKQPLKKLAAGFLVSRDSWYLVGVLGWDSWGLFQPQIPII